MISSNNVDINILLYFILAFWLRCRCHIGTRQGTRGGKSKNIQGFLGFLHWTFNVVPRRRPISHHPVIKYSMPLSSFGEIQSRGPHAFVSTHVSFSWSTACLRIFSSYFCLSPLFLVIKMEGRQGSGWPWIFFFFLIFNYFLKIFIELIWNYILHDKIYWLFPGSTDPCNAYRMNGASNSSYDKWS